MGLLLRDVMWSCRLAVSTLFNGFPDLLPCWCTDVYWVYWQISLSACCICGGSCGAGLTFSPPMTPIPLTTAAALAQVVPITGAGIKSAPPEQPLDLPSDLDSLIILDIQIDSRLLKLNQHRGGRPSAERPQRSRALGWLDSQHSNPKQLLPFPTAGETKPMQLSTARLTPQDQRR